MFRNVLVPVDLTDRHGPAVAIAGQLAGGGGAVTLLHVIEMIHGVGREDEPAFYDRLERHARGHLDRLAAGLRGRAGSVTADVVYGERGPAVVKYAAVHGADLIVLTSHPVEFSDPGAGWNTLSYFIGIAARCPVLLVK
ncbi:MAG TPA: universal stress protein [Gemmataceae bacterium]|jgi:nucleotide-binding universal stress UspA family protein